MTSQPYDPKTDLRGCTDARYIPLESITNADVSGIAVVVAIVVVTFCLRIQITWSSTYIDGPVISSLTQLYSIFLSTLLSINRQQLSLFDANHTLLISSSPLTVQLVFASICDLFGFETDFFKRIQSHRLIIRAFGALLLPLWFGLNLTIPLSSRAFKDSELCSNSTFKNLLLVDPLLLFPLFLFLFLLPFPLVTFALFTIFTITLCLCTILITISPHAPPVPPVVSNLTAVRYLFFLNFCFQFGLLSVLKPPRNTVFRSRTSLTREQLLAYTLCSGFILFELFWAGILIANASLASGSEYEVSYGQLVPLFAAVPPLMSIAKLGHAHRWDLFDFFRYLPGRMHAVLYD